MTDTRLNNLLVLHVHKDRCDSLVLEDCLNEFVCGSEHRLSVWQVLTLRYIVALFSKTSI